MEIRPIALTDIETCIDVFYEADEKLTVASGLPVQPRNPGAIDRIFRHVAGSTPERAWLAQQDGQVLGFGMAADRGDLCFLAFLFVRPSAQAAGLGKTLYDRCMPADGFRATCIWSVQPISTSVYARAGLVPRVPMYTFIGRPRMPLARLEAGVALTPIDPLELDELDAEVIGFTRPVDHLAWQRWDRRPFAVRDGSRLIGYGYAQPAGRLGPLVVRNTEHLLPLVGSLMDQIDAVEDWMVHVPGPAETVFATLLRAGMRFDGPPIIFCATEQRVDHTRYLPASFALP
jgi:hypothetical protein